jgi:hypothetical protein
MLFLALVSPVVVLGLLLVMQSFEGYMFGSESTSQRPETGQRRQPAEARKLRSAVSGGTRLEP